MATTSKPPQIADQQPDVPKLIAGLTSEPHSTAARVAAIEALRAARDTPGANVRIAALLRALFASFPPSDCADPEALRLAQAWVIDAVADRPMWAIADGLRSLALRARFRPTPAEILEAIDAARSQIADPLAEARAAAILAQRPEKPPAPTDDAKERIAALVNRQWGERP